MCLALAFDHAAIEQRDESAGESALGKQPAENVGQHESQLPGIAHRRCAENARNEDVAHETEHAADRGQPADSPDILEQAHRSEPPVRVSGSGFAGRRACALLLFLGPRGKLLLVECTEIHRVEH